MYMPSESEKLLPPSPKSGLSLSVDVWAVLLAFLLALLVRVGVLQHISW
jgi:hypothetical protein